jgi:hypothetical protein
MVRASDSAVLSDRSSAGSLLDCQQEARAEARTRHCKDSQQRVEVTFTGDFNGIAIQPITMHISCPKK